MLRMLLGKTVHDPMDAVFDQRNVKVDEEADRFIHQTQVRKQLSVMDRQKLFH